jgi:hypothetical protein
MTFDEKVDKVLERMGRGDRVNIFPIISWHAKEGDRNQQRLIASFMEGKDLIRIDRDGYIIGHFGIDVLKEYGSWLSYLEKAKSDKQLTKEKISIWKILERGVIVVSLILFSYFIYDRYCSNDDKSGQQRESTTTEKTELPKQKTGKLTPDSTILKNDSLNNDLKAKK